MLEGKELEKQLGQYGSVSVDIDDKLVLKVALEGHIDLLAELKKVAEKSGNQIVIKLVDIIEGLLKK